MKDPRAVEPLIAALKDTDAYVRRAAAGALGNLKDTRGVEPLIGALKDAESYVGCTAAAALGQLKDTRAVEPLAEALKDAHLRVSAALALAWLKDERAVEPLIVALETDEGWLYSGMPGEGAQALSILTGVDFGQDGKKWRAWWEENKGRPALRDGTKSE